MTLQLPCVVKCKKISLKERPDIVLTVSQWEQSGDLAVHLYGVFNILSSIFTNEAFNS
jgi:hypothetical protein